MAVTPTSLKARWTEFGPTDNAVVQGAIDEAARQCDASVYGASQDDAVTLLACHRLAVSPQGMSSRLEGGDAPLPSSTTTDLARTTYGAALLNLMRARGGGAWCIGAWGAR